MKRIACLSAFAIAALGIGAQTTSTYKTIKATEAVRIESPAGTVPRLPYQLWVTYSDGTMEYDLIITGRQAIDGDTAQVGPQIAEHLDLPQVSYMEDLQYDEATKTFTIRKQMEDGYQILEMQAPCVVTALASAVNPRYMTVNGIVTSYDKEVEVWGADRINVPEDRIGKAGSPTSVFKSFPKQLKPAGQTFEVTPEEAVELIVNKLKEKHII